MGKPTAQPTAQPMVQRFRGVFTIPVTPFDERGALDQDSLQRVVDWCVRAGAHGVVAPVNASEAPALTDEERGHVTRLVVEAVGGRVPVVIGVSGVSQQASVLYTRWAREAGADSVIAMPPYGVRFTDAESIHAFYRAVAEAAGLPVWVQNWSGPAGTAMSGDQVTRLLREIPGVAYLKEETLDAGHLMTAVLAKAGDACQGVMGGIGGRYLFEEVHRGARGTMPACQTTDIHVAIWSRLDAGDEPGARVVFNRLLPLLNLEARHGVALYKEVLRRRGVIPNATVRGRAASPLDAADHRELDVVLTEIADLFTI